MDTNSMTGTAVANYVKMNRPVVYVDPKNMRKESAKNYLIRAAGPKSPFPGQQIRANGQDGQFSIGFGTGAKVKDSIKYIVNVPQTIATWQYWPDGEAPTYPFICTVFGGDSLPPRSACGPVETKYNKMKKEDQDVWSEGMVLILRDPKTNELCHLTAFNNVHRKAGEFILNIADAVELENGKLPLVEMNFEKVKLKDGGSFYSVTFNIVEWVKATKADMPEGVAAVPAVDEDADEPVAPKRGRRQEVEEDEQPPAKRKALPKPEPVEDEEDEAPKRGRHAENNPPSADDMEDDRPTVRSRRSSVEAEPVKRGRREEPEADEAEEDEQPVRKRRARLN